MAGLGNLDPAMEVRILLPEPMLQKTDIPMGRINAFLFFYQVDLFFILYISCNKKPLEKTLR